MGVGGEVSFRLGRHDPRYPLIIDPTLAWHTFLGGRGDIGRAIAVDGSGNVYVTGDSDYTWGSPVRAYTSGVFNDAFVAKLGSDGSLTWNTFLGGSDQDVGYGVAVDGSRNVYVTGLSGATWIETPVRAFTGGYDAFVAKLGSDGSLTWHTFLGGSKSDLGRSIAVDSSGSVYVSGDSYAAWAETPVRAYTAYIDTFAAKLGSDGGLTWHTFLGGSSYDYGLGIAVDSSGNAYVAGDSGAAWAETPVRAYTAGQDAFAAKLGSDGDLAWHTFLGGGDWDEGYGIAVDGYGNVYVAGRSIAAWAETPVRAYAGGWDAFAAKLGSDGRLAWHTFLGGSNWDRNFAIAVDGSENVYVAGCSDATWGSPVWAYSGGVDAFAARLGNDGGLTWNTFLGGSGSDYGLGIAVDGSGNVYMAGFSDAAWGNPVRAYTANDDAFVAKLEPLNLAKLVSPTTARPGEAITYTVSLNNTGTVTATNVTITDTLSANVIDPGATSSGVTLTQVPGSQYAWAVSDLPPGQGGVITITGVLARPLAAQVFTNTATLALSGTAVLTVTAPLTVENVAPVVDAGTDQSASAGQTVALHGSGADDNGDALAYLWTQTGGPAVTLSDPTAPGPTFTAPDASAVLTFTLTVTDTGNLTGTDEVVVTVKETAPKLAIVKSVNPPSARPGEAITYTISLSNTGAVTATAVTITDALSANIINANTASSGVVLTQAPGSRYAWIAPDLLLGQGAVITITGVLSKPLAAQVFTNTATLVASGIVKTAQVSLTVQNVAPAADAGPDQSADAGQAVTLNASGADDNGDALTYLWAQTGGPAVTLSDPAGVSPTFAAPASPAVLTFTLTVTDTSHLTSTDEVVVTIVKGYACYLPVVAKNTTRP